MPWSNDTKHSAQVICVILGFSYVDHKVKYIYDGDHVVKTKEISPYLTASPTVFVEAHSKPLGKQPRMMVGTSLKDNGIYIFTKDEKDEFLTKEPGATKYMHPYLNGVDLLNGKSRYCLWLIHANPVDLQNLPLVRDKIRQVHDYRASHSGRDLQAFKDRPMLPVRLRYYSFKHSNSALALPQTSTSRKYFPMSFVDKNSICGSGLYLIGDCSIYQFGIIDSIVHMTWAKLFCARLGSGYRYSNTMVYNNFPWASPTSEQKAKIEATAQAILNTRKNYPDSSLADLYDPLLMPQDLRKAHEANDKAVLEAYGLKASASDNEIMAKLLKMYQILVQTKD